MVEFIVVESKNGTNYGSQAHQVTTLLLSRQASAQVDLYLSAQRWLCGTHFGLYPDVNCRACQGFGVAGHR